MVRETEIMKDVQLLRQYVAERFDVSLKESDAKSITKEFQTLFDEWGWAKADLTSAGHLIWISGQLQKREYFNIPHVNPTEIRLFAILHFWAWEGSEWSDTDTVDIDIIPDWPTTIRRSPLSRIGDIEPINAVARRIAGNGSRPCPYCRQYYRNPAALSLHLLESHTDALNE